MNSINLNIVQRINKTFLSFAGICLLTTLLSMFIQTTVFAQTDNVGIGTTTPNQAALLDLESSSMGLLIPRMTTAQRDLINGGVFPDGLIIYNTGTNQFEYYNSVDGWKAIMSGSGAPWYISGNAGSTPWDGAAGNYIGTSDAQDLVIATNATEVIRVTSTNDIEISRNHATASASLLTINQASATDANIAVDVDQGGTGSAMKVLRDNPAGAMPLMDVIQDNAGDASVAVKITQDGTEHGLESEYTNTDDEIAAVYGHSSTAGVNQTVGVWGRASGAAASAGNIGVFASGNGTNNVALQLNDGGFAIGREEDDPTPGLSVEPSTGGVDYTAEGPSGVIELTLGAAGDLVTAAPAALTFQDLGTVVVTNGYCLSNSIVLVNVIQKINDGVNPSPLDAVFHVDVSSRDSGGGQFTLRLGMTPSQAHVDNYTTDDKIRIGYLIVNPSK